MCKQTPSRTHTPWKIYMEPKQASFDKEYYLPNHHLSVPCWIFNQRTTTTYIQNKNSHFPPQIHHWIPKNHLKKSILKKDVDSRRRLTRHASKAWDVMCCCEHLNCVSRTVELGPDEVMIKTVTLWHGFIRWDSDSAWMDLGVVGGPTKGEPLDMYTQSTG